MIRPKRNCRIVQTITSDEGLYLVEIMYATTLVDQDKWTQRHTCHVDKRIYKYT